MGLIEKGDIGITSVNFSRVSHTGRDIVAVPLLVCPCPATDGQIDFAFQHDAELGGMGMLREIDVLVELHEDDLMAIRLR